jgi:uridine kinase
MPGAPSPDARDPIGPRARADRVAGVGTTGRIEHSSSTWRQPMPPAPSAPRAAVLDRVAERIHALGLRRVRVGVDGRTGAGKTTFGHELARRLADAGRVVLRASLDDFKRPWREAHRYDRMTAAGYYANAWDTEAVRRLLLDPAAPGGSRLVALCSIDPLTQIDHSQTRVEMPPDGVLVVDGVFACRPELFRSWDLRIWLEIDRELSLRRGIARDADMEGGADKAHDLHRRRYVPADTIYIDEVDPASLAEVVVDNADVDRPRLIRG